LPDIRWHPLECPAVSIADRRFIGYVVDEDSPDLQRKTAGDDFIDFRVMVS